MRTGWPLPRLLGLERLLVLIEPEPTVIGLEHLLTPGHLMDYAQTAPAVVVIGW
jgi:hypothetical protein